MLYYSRDGICAIQWCEGELKSRILLEKSRFIFGGVFFCLAYLPVLVNTSANNESENKVLCCNSSDDKKISDIPLELTKETIDFSVASSYFGSTRQSLTLNSDFIASIGNSIGDMKEISAFDDTFDNIDTFDNLNKTNINNTRAESRQTEYQNDKENISKKISKQIAQIDITKPKHRTVNVAGYTGATLVKGEINSSFYVDAKKSGIPANIIDLVIKNLSEKVNFKHSLKRGDKFEVIYSKKDLVYAKITTKRANIAVYKVTNGKNSAYYFANGEQCHQQTKNSSFGQPLAGKLSISDRFGWRMHPITHRFHNHSGVDLRAPHGTPVYAIYDGVVKRASRYAGYGNCIDIQHVGGYSSRYAHLSKYAVHLGTHVKKGQIIGYVGATGVATGSHLHLELAKNNYVINPLSIKMMPTQKALVSNRRKFELFKKQINNAVNKS
ncbi:MAG: M23 family metallopeptidase [Alphaproteobacteria bacterium]|nr:M23 family metallopeptidase [Alphaproteobacteria bacterium]